MEHKDGILIDWLSITSKTMFPEDMMKLIGITSGWQLRGRGVRGYGDSYYYNSIQIHFGGTQDNVWLEMSGQGCRSFESDSFHKDYNVIFDALMNNLDTMRVTRLDVAFDDFSGLLDIDRICDDTRPRNHKYKAKTDYAQVIESTNGMSCDVGSPKSLLLVRIYDKLAERLSKMRGAEDREKVRESIPHWVRCELQLRDERALEFVRYLRGKDPITGAPEPMELGQAYCGVLANYLDYGYEVPARDNPDKKVWHRFPYWKKFLNEVGAISLYRKPGKGYNLERMVNFVQNNAGNAIDAAISIFGPSKFFDLITSRQISQNVKYLDLIKQHGTYEERMETEMAIDYLDRLGTESKEEKENRHPFYKVFARPEWVVWGGVRHCMCRECNEVMPAKAFVDVSHHSNFALCYKCHGKQQEIPKNKNT